MAQVLLENPIIGTVDSTDNRSGPLPSGILVVDKPEGMTSFAVVKQIERQLPLEKAGHCGTLDPFATGVLLICVNQATRISDQLSLQSKRYVAALRLGIETDTLDRCGHIVRRYEGEPVTIESLKAALEPFRGMYRQQVPRYSAVHVDGRRLYEYARKGIEIDAPAREVNIHNLELTAFEWPLATLDVCCSKGTYIRQLGMDIGQYLGCGAHLSELRRLESGSFRIEQAMTLDDLRELKDLERLRQRIVPMSEALDHLTRVVMEDGRQLKRLQEGSLDSAWEAAARKACPQRSAPVQILDGRGDLRALWWPDLQGEQGRRLRVFKH